MTSIEGVNQLRFSFSKRGAATAVNYGVNYISLKRDPNEIIESDLKYKAAQNALKNELDEEVALWEDEIVSVKESLNTYQHNQREIKTLLESEIERAQYLTNISSIYKTVLEDLEELLGKPDIEIDPELEKKIEEVNELLWYQSQSLFISQLNIISMNKLLLLINFIQILFSFLAVSYLSTLGFILMLYNCWYLYWEFLFLIYLLMNLFKNNQAIFIFHNFLGVQPTLFFFLSSLDVE